MLPDLFARLAMPRLYRGPSGGLLRGINGGLASGATGEAPCCCGPPVPEDCGGVSGGRVCVTEFFDAFPLSSNNAAYLAFIAGQDVDATFSGFTGAPNASSCDCPAIINGTRTIGNGGVFTNETRWETSTGENQCGINNYDLTMRFSVTCNGNGTCTFTMLVSFTKLNSGGTTIIFQRSAAYQKTVSSPLAAFPITLPLIDETMTDTPSNTCTGVGSSCVVALH